MRLRAMFLVAAISFGTLALTPGGDAHYEGEKLCTSHGMVRWTPTRKWPPNHKFFPVDIKFEENEQDGDQLRLEVKNITHSEAGEEKGATARHEPDANGEGISDTAADLTPPQPPAPPKVQIELRAERMGTSKRGRTYHIEVECTDTGSVTNEPVERGTAVLKVRIPHSKKA